MLMHSVQGSRSEFLKTYRFLVFKKLKISKSPNFRFFKSFFSLV